MSVSFGCHCPERQKPVAERRWFVIQRNCRCSAFDGYRTMRSAWSSVVCLSCSALGRTRAAYVDRLKDAPADWYSRMGKPEPTPEPPPVGSVAFRGPKTSERPSSPPDAS